MTLIEELFEVATAAAEARVQINEPGLQKPLAAIHHECEKAKRAWSGSNLGYHATVYYENLEPKPPGVEFSSEWGLMDRWPTHQPAPGWRVMDYQAVVDELLLRAGSPEIDAIEKGLAPLRETLSDLKERAISLLTSAYASTKDPYLGRKLKQIEDLVIADRNAIEETLIPDGGWSRDSLAVTKGNRIAPHQCLIALCLSATVLESGVSNLMKAARESALHLERLEKEQRKMPSTGKTVFLGHGRSLAWRELKDFLRERLHLAVDEFNSLSAAGIPTTTRLEEILAAAGFAFLIMTAEDEQADGTFHARLNVVHEAGLFQGRLGFRKAIVLLEDTCEEFSNVRGLGQIRFPKGDISARFEEIRAV
jgi:hypothetical protein